MKKEFSINYQKHWDENGTCYSQTVNISRKTLDKLKDILQSKIILNHKKVLTSDIFWLKSSFGEVENGLVFTNLTQRDFFNRYLKLNLKDRNTCFSLID